jgi:tetratricopeptide (TPR) repeat protein
MQDLAVNLSQSGRPQEALETLEEAFRLAKEVGDRLNLQRMYNNYASTLANQGDLARARVIAAEGVELGRRIGGIGWLAWIVGTLGEISMALGDLAEAEELNREALAYSIATHDGPLIALRYPILAQILPCGRTDEVRRARSCARAPVGEEEPQAIRGWTEAMLASALGRADDACPLRHGVEPERFTSTNFSWPTHPLARAWGYQEAQAARAVPDDGAGLPVRAEVATACSSYPVAASTAAGRCVDALTKVDLARALLDLGRVERRADRDPRASFERARSLLLDCDAAYFVPHVEAELADLG